MRNLPFWEKFFRNTLSERKREASALIAAVCGSDSERVAAEMRLLEERYAQVKAAAPHKSVDELQEIEQEVTGVIAGSPAPVRYLECEAIALWWLIEQLVHSRSANGDVCDREQDLLANIELASKETFDACCLAKLLA